MAQLTTLKASDQQVEIARLQDELAMRDQLVQQLSQELFRLVKGNQQFLPTADVSDRHQVEVRALREQLQGVEKQVAFYQEQLQGRDEQIHQMRQTVQELTDRTRMLEQVVQELPKIYKQKFAERMLKVKQRVGSIQQENRQLHAELQNVSYRLAVRTRRNQHCLDLPTFPTSMLGQNAMPSFSEG